jgi:hypothetical protein
MLTEIYFEALLIDEALADQLWRRGNIQGLAMWLRAQLGR